MVMRYFPHPWSDHCDTRTFFGWTSYQTFLSPTIWFFKSILAVANLRPIVVIILAIISTYLCDHFDLYVEFPMTLIGIAVVFPIVFSINGTYLGKEPDLNDCSFIDPY